MAALNIHLLIVAVQLGLALCGFGNNYGGGERFDMAKGVHVIDKGERKPGDDKLYSETLREKGQSLDGDEYCYPPNGEQITITEVEVKDQDTANDGGLAFEVSGGDGQNQFCFALKSRHGKSYHYKVDIYGYRGLHNGNMGVPMGGVGVPMGGIPPNGMGGPMGTNYGTGYGNPGFGGTGRFASGSTGSFYGGANGGSGYGNPVNTPYGSGNAGYGNTGYSNTGYGNTGYDNNGYGNNGYRSGYNGGKK